MEHRVLGKSGLWMSALSLRLGVDPPAAEAIALARAAGVDSFVLGPGAEEAAAKLFADAGGDLVLATTLRVDGAVPGSLSRGAVLGACEESLRRLGRDWLDLLLLPGFDPGTPLAETLRALDDLTSQGKVRYVGVSGFAAWQIMKALGIAADQGWNRPVASEVRYSIGRRDAEFDHFPLALDEGVGQLARAATELGAVAAAASAVGAERGVPTSQVAVNWALANPAVASVVLDAGAPDLEEALAAATWSLGREERARLDGAAACRQPYPQWHQINWANDRPVGPDRTAPPAPQSAEDGV